MSDVMLSINKDIVNPIVDAKIKEAVLAAMGGSEKIIEGVVNTIINHKVNAEGKVGSYSSDNKYTWIDVVVKNQIQDRAREAIISAISEHSEQIKDAIVNHLKTKKGAEATAKALLHCMSGTFSKHWHSNIKIELSPYNND
jgi:hypothetical protein